MWPAQLCLQESVHEQMVHIGRRDVVQSVHDLAQYVFQGGRLDLPKLPKPQLQVEAGSRPRSKVLWIRICSHCA